MAPIRQVKHKTGQSFESTGDQESPITSKLKLSWIRQAHTCQIQTLHSRSPHKSCPGDQIKPSKFLDLLSVLSS